MIKLYNSQSRSVEEFVPISPGLVDMYICGPTVYSPAHIGNARPALVFDQLYRLLRYEYPQDGAVRYVRNITDIDDKIIAAANEQGVPITHITDSALAAYHLDLDALNCLKPYMEPRATHHVGDMKRMIENLIRRGHAYEVDGEVFFEVTSNPYPMLANHTDTQAGSRIEVDPRKKDPRDFVLWKPAKEGEPSWASDWGYGRPGWHIECSAMIDSTFSRDTIDIHGGGQDLRFPHHEAECAQSSCAHQGEPLAKYWMHNGLLTVEGEKMSKSRGNVVLLYELFEKYPAESVRYYFLRTHYRSPMDFSLANLEQAHRALDGLYEALYRMDDVNYAEAASPHVDVLSALRNDLNTPGAIAALHKVAHDMEHGSPDQRAGNKAALLASGQMLGLFAHTPYQWRTLGIDKEAVEVLIAARQQARLSKNYDEADRLRNELDVMGITLADGAHGTEWRRS